MNADDDGFVSLLSWERGLKSMMILNCCLQNRSLLSWERGLKYTTDEQKNLEMDVAPLVGAWIEMQNYKSAKSGLPVAPLVGAWIEICNCQHNSNSRESLLSWERGLKYHELAPCEPIEFVAPLVGAWIEISIATQTVAVNGSRSSRGSVD